MQRPLRSEDADVFAAKLKSRHGAKVPMLGN